VSASTTCATPSSRARCHCTKHILEEAIKTSAARLKMIKKLVFCFQKHLSCLFEASMQHSVDGFQCEVASLKQLCQWCQDVSQRAKSRTSRAFFQIAWLEPITAGWSRSDPSLAAGLSVNKSIATKHNDRSCASNAFLTPMRIRDDILWFQISFARTRSFLLERDRCDPWALAVCTNWIRVAHPRASRFRTCDRDSARVIILVHRLSRVCTYQVRPCVERRLRATRLSPGTTPERSLHMSWW
jgi:hypothetical protein